MKQARRKRRIETDQEVTLIPVMNLFVVLIPFLLITAAFVNFGGIETHMPQRAAGSTSTESLGQEIALTFRLEGETISVQGYRSQFEQSVPELSRTFTLNNAEEFKVFLDQVHTEFPLVNVALFYAAPDVPYENVIRVMNVIEVSSLDTRLTVATGVAE